MRSRRPRASSMAGARRQHDAGDEPARQAQFNNGDQRAVRIERARGSAQIIQLLHGALHRFISATMDAISSPPPHSISFGGFRTPAAEHAASSLKRPASETLHISGSELAVKRMVSIADSP